MEIFGENLNNQNEEAAKGQAFEQLRAREIELERMNEIQINLAITLFPEEEDVSASMTKWIMSDLSKEFRKLIDDPSRDYKVRFLNADTKIMDDAYAEILEILKTKYHAENTN